MRNNLWDYLTFNNNNPALTGTGQSLDKAAKILGLNKPLGYNEYKTVPARNVFSLLSYSSGLKVSPSFNPMVSFSEGITSGYLPSKAMASNTPHELTNTVNQVKDFIDHASSGKPTIKEVENLLTLYRYAFNFLEPNSGDDYIGSHYQAIKLQAAIAQALDSNTSSFLLACADLSGVQKFIYDISSKGASKALKGRSFYLQLLIDAVLDSVLTANNLSTANIIYSSGGKSFFILPNTDEVKQKFHELRREIQQEIFKRHNLTLYICMDYVEVDISKTTNIFEGENNIWKQVTEKVSRQKSSKLDLFINTPEGFSSLFEPETGDPSDVCSLTGLPLAGQKRYKNEDEVFSEIVDLQIKLGKQLRSGSENEDLNFQVLSNYILKRIEKVGNSEPTLIFANEQNLHYIHLNEPKRAFELALKNEAIHSFKFYGGTSVAWNGANAKEFDELAQGSTSVGAKKLGVLRMDVDGLGEAFISGLKGKARGFAGYATLSAACDYFFTGYLNHLRSEGNHQDYLNIVYSGGDDLFIVGFWDNCIRFANEVQSAFKEYTRNPNLSLSGGVAIVDGKFPIAKAADLADEAEKEAKAYKRETSTGVVKAKDAFHLFGETIGWEEFEKVWEETLNYSDLVYKTKALPVSTLFNIMAAYLSHKKEASKPVGVSKNLSYIWVTTYKLSRQADALNKITHLNAVNKLRQLIAVIIKSASISPEFKINAVAAKYSNFLNR